VHMVIMEEFAEVFEVTHITPALAVPVPVRCAKASDVLAQLARVHAHRSGGRVRGSCRATIVFVRWTGTNP
jgi:hypothetical protein